MCELCVIQPHYYGEVLPYITLIKANKDGTDIKAGNIGFLYENEVRWSCPITPILYDTMDDTYTAIEQFKKYLKFDIQLGHYIFDQIVQFKLPIPVLRLIVKYNAFYSYYAKIYLYLAWFISNAKIETI